LPTTSVEQNAVRVVLIDRPHLLLFVALFSGYLGHRVDDLWARLDQKVKRGCNKREADMLNSFRLTRRYCYRALLQIDLDIVDVEGVLLVLAGQHDKHGL